MKKLFIFLSIFLSIEADVKLVNIFNLSNSITNVEIDGEVTLSKKVITSQIPLAPKTDRFNLNIELLSKKNKNPSTIKIPQNNYFYYPSGETPQIDVVIDQNNVVHTIETNPDTNATKKRFSVNMVKKPGHDWIFDRVLIKSVDNKSHDLVEVNSGLKRASEVLTVYNHVDIAPNSKGHANIRLDRGQELVITITNKDGKQRKAEYLPTGKSDSLEIIIDKNGKPFIHEARQSMIEIPTVEVMPVK